MISQSIKALLTCQSELTSGEPPTPYLYDTRIMRNIYLLAIKLEASVKTLEPKRYCSSINNQETSKK